MGGVRVGLKDAHYAILTKDDATGFTYSAPVALPGSVSAKVSAKSNSATLYSDDAASETATSLGEITVDFEAKDLPLSVQAALLGHTIANGVMTRNASDQAPYLAFGFRSRKSNGKYRYVWLYKGQFSVPDDQYKTEADKPDLQTQTISGTFITLAYNGAWQVTGDEDESGFTAGSTWFNSVVGSNVDTTAPTVTVTPADGATGVSASADVVWVFSEAIQVASVTSANFFVTEAVSGNAVAGSLSISADNKTVTFTPTAALTSATEYTAIATTNVKDVAGNALAANSVTNFTIA